MDIKKHLLISLTVCPLALFGALFDAHFFYVRIVCIGLLVLGVPWFGALLIMMAVSRARGQTDWLAKQLLTLAWSAQIVFYLLLSIRLGDILAERDMQVLRTYLETEVKASKDQQQPFADGFTPLNDYRSLCAKYEVEWRAGDKQSTFRFRDPRTAIAHQELMRERGTWTQVD